MVRVIVAAVLMIAATASQSFAGTVQVVCFGDSLTAGSGSSGSLVYPVYLQAMLGMGVTGGLQGQEVLNKGIVGNRTGDMVARLAADVLAYRPRVAVIEGGTNDLVNGVTQTEYITNMTTMITQCQATGVLPVVVLIMPRNTAGSTTAIMQERDRWNAALVTLAASYGVPVVDTGPFVGQFRAGGDAGNLWDMQAAYDSGDHLHYNSAGQMQYAIAIYLTVKPLFTQVVASSVVNSINTPSSVFPPSARATTFNGSGFSSTLRH